MTTRILSFAISAIVGLFVPGLASGSEPDDEHIRHNPRLEAGDTISSGSLTAYPFLNIGANRITMNGASWQHLAEHIASPHASRPLTVVHIGDSHIQADGNTGRVRKHLQTRYGNAGRGLISPLRLAGTNQPLDYSITSSGTALRATLLKMPWPTTMGFTGVSLAPQQYNTTYTLSLPTPADTLSIYGRGDFNISQVHADDIPLTPQIVHNPLGQSIILPHSASKVTLTLRGSGYNIYAFDARTRSNRAPGILYHAIGNNGATFSTYSLIPSFAESIAALTPDLIIISLGTNEAFSRMSDDTFLASIHTLVSDLRQHNPHAALLLTTPSECQRSSYTYRRRRGRRGRRRTTTRTYIVNTRVAHFRELIMDYGKQHNIPVYDFYTVAGGKGASAQWLRHRLLATDRIHRTWAGYHTEGDLLSSALLKSLSPDPE